MARLPVRAPLNRSVSVLGTGAFLPSKVVTNEDLEKLVTNYDPASGDFSTWVDRVTHIHERRFISSLEENAGVMAAHAARQALEMAGLKPTDLDLIIHASFTPSISVPGDHVICADLLGAKATPSFTLMGACAGSVYGMAMAYGLLASGAMQHILVTGSETITPTLDYGDPLTSILFGDGAGAVVMGAVDKGGGFLPPYLGFEFNWENIQMANANLPFTGRPCTAAGNGGPPLVERSYLKMISGPSVLRNAVGAMADSVWRVLGYRDGPPNGGEGDDLRARLRVVPHQANGRIVDGLTRKLRTDEARTTKTIYKVGNISAASNLIALDFAVRRGNYRADRDPQTEKILAIHEVDDPIRKGDLVVLPSIGAGYLFGAVALVW